MQTNLDLTKFPVVGDDYDLISIDLYKFDPDGEQYVAQFTYLIVDDETETVNAGLIQLTGITGDSYVEIAEKLDFMIQAGLFICPVSAVGTVYDHDMNEIEEINWNDLQETSEIIIPTGTMLQ